MNEFRTNLVLKAYGKFDKNGDGIVNTTDLKGVYNANKHPDVINGKKTQDEVFLEFLETFEAHFADRHGGQKDGNISREEFIEYYNNVSMSIDLDSYFELMINNAWNLDGSRVERRGWGGAY